MKRAIAFLALLVLGFFLLGQLVDEDLILEPSKAAEKTTGLPEKPRREPVGGVGTGQGGSGATVEQIGPLHLPKVRDVPQSDGSVRRETVFVLDAEDSQPLQSGLQRLDGVDVTLFENGEPAGKIHARRAFVELGRDENGNRSVVADKEVSLDGVVFDALPGTRAEGLHIELERAMVLVDESEVQLYTPSPDDPVKVTFQGERSVTLEGKGLQSRMPRDLDGALQRVDLEILADPIVTTAGIRAQATGSLRYVEDLVQRAGRLTLDENVVLVFDRQVRLAGRSSGSATTITGDQLTAWFLRDGDDRDPRASWRMLQLIGAPAAVELEEARLATPRLTVLPGLSGEPCWISASGGESTIDERVIPGQVRRRPPVHGRSARRITLWRSSEQVGAVHRSYGFPEWAIAPLTGLRAVDLEGEAHVADDERTIDADHGIRLFHLSPRRPAVLARGFGHVSLEQIGDTAEEPLVARGDNGFELLANDEEERLDLGPAFGRDGWQEHRYVISQGPLHATGTGTCRLRRRNGLSIVELQTAAEGIEAVFSDRDAELRDVRWLRAELEGEEVRSVLLAGLPATAIVRRGGETLTATAPWIEQTSSNSLRLLPPDAAEPQRWEGLDAGDRLPRLRREMATVDPAGTQSVTTTAPRIDIYYLGADDVVVDATGRDAGGLAHVEGTITDADHETIEIRIDAERLRALPFAIPPDVATTYAGGGDAVSMLPFTPFSNPWLIGDGVRRIEVEGSGDGSFEGFAERMILAAGARAGLLIGDGDTMTPATIRRTTGDRVLIARGAQVRILQEDELRLQAFRAFPNHSAFLLPEIEMHRTDDDGLFAHLRATCRGDLEILPNEARFDGPVNAVSIAPDGAPAKGALGIVAEHLHMDIDADTGEVRKVHGRDVSLDWPRLSGRASELDLDLLWKTCVMSDPDGARVVLGRRTVVIGQMVKVNFETLALEAAYRYRIEPFIGRTENDGAEPR